MDTEYGDVVSVVTPPVASPTGKQVWRYHCPSGRAIDGSDVGLLDYVFQTAPRKVYWAACYLVDPFPTGMDEWHTQFFYPDTGNDCVVSMKSDLGFHLYPFDYYGGSVGYGIDVWANVEFLFDAVNEQASIWVNGSAVYLNNSVNTTCSTIPYIKAASTVHGSGTTDIATNLYLAHNRISIYV